LRISIRRARWSNRGCPKGNPDVEKNLSAAADLSSLSAATAAAARLAGQEQLWSSIAARRQELWQRWDQKLPRNQFVLRQLAEAQTSRVE